MALDDLIARLEADADARVQAIRQRADGEVRALDAEAARAAAEVTRANLARRRAALQAELRRELALARQKARAQELEARRALFQRVLSRAEALVAEVGASPAYLAVLPGHCTEALSYLEALRPIVRCAPALVPVLEPAVAGREDVQLVPDEALGPGLVAEAADGSVLVDNTLLARVRRREARLAVELLEALPRAPEGGAP